ncbi:hypothetical protein JHK84_054947 [Glycine max]|nr:hypothetical protein JHK84_054947 [Glycine max]
MNSSLTSRFGFSSTASHEHASEEAKVCDQSEQVEAADQTKESGLIKMQMAKSPRKKLKSVLAQVLVIFWGFSHAIKKKNTFWT